MIMIEFCRSNLASWTQGIYEQLTSDPEWAEIEVIEYGCLGNCGQCYIQPFAMVNGEIVAGIDPDELLDNIRSHIKKKNEEDKMWRELGF